MTLHIFLLHTLLQMWVDQGMGSQITVYVFNSMQRIIMHVLTFTAVSASETQYNMMC